MVFSFHIFIAFCCGITRDCGGFVTVSYQAINAIPSNYSDLSAGAVLFSNGMVGGAFSGYPTYRALKETSVNQWWDRQSDFWSGDQKYLNWYIELPNDWLADKSPMETYPSGQLRLGFIGKTIDLTKINKIRYILPANGNHYGLRMCLLSADKRHYYSGETDWAYRKQLDMDVSAFTGHYFWSCGGSMDQIVAPIQILLLS